MKQHITPQDLSELTDSEKEKLRKWFWPSQLNIGSFVTIKHSNDVFCVTGYDPYLNLELALENAMDRNKVYISPQYVSLLLSIGQMVE